MATQKAQTNETKEWVVVEGSTGWSGSVQNEDKNSVLLAVTKTGEAPPDGGGAFLEGGLYQKLPIAIGGDEELHFKPAHFSFAKIRLI